MVAQPFSGSHASMTDEEKALMGIGQGLVRLCFGLEALEDLQEDLLQAFQTAEQATRE
ncbi:Methionine gamma-lyase [compost metagenome]